MADDRCDLLCIDFDTAERLRLARPPRAMADAAAGRARALADPTRLIVATALADADGELCVCDLAWIAERSIGAVSHHLRVLRADGLAESRREGKMIFYRLTRDGRALLEAVLRPAEQTA